MYKKKELTIRSDTVADTKSIEPAQNQSLNGLLWRMGVQMASGIVTMAGKTLRTLRELIVAKLEGQTYLLTVPSGSAEVVLILSCWYTHPVSACHQ